jgi:hypothetical protein
MSDRSGKIVFLLSSCFLALFVSFGFGAAVVRYQVWPYEFLARTYTAAKTLFTQGDFHPGGLLWKVPEYVSREPVRIHRPELVGDGYYVLVGWSQDLDSYAALLHDHLGRHLHTWKLDYLAWDPDGPTNTSDMPHGFQVLRDGSVIVGFDKGDFLFRIDACGDPVWMRAGIYHHSIQLADNGTFWTWRAVGHPDGHYQYLAKLDVDSGDTIREISLVDDVIKKMGEESIIFGVRPDFEFVKFDTVPKDVDPYDIFHPNDIDVLSTRLAEEFPDFDPGDLLISLRQNNLVAVLDSTMGRVKWWSHGPWRLQHDPDFTSDGKISIYNNNSGRHRSEIIKIDPETGDVSNELFGGDIKFYSGGMGKHQYLPNGNVLIVVPEEGRLVEVTKDGDPVIEFSNIAFDEFNGHVQNGVWLPPDYFQRLPACDRRAD